MSCSQTTTTPDALTQLLRAVASGETSIDAALEALRTLPFEDLDFAKLDHHRQLRTGSAEVVYCEGKTPQQVAAIVAKLAAVSPQVLGTRATVEQYEAARALTPQVQFHELARCIYLDQEPKRQRHDGVLIVCAGTSDLAIAEEAALALDMLGHRAARINDVGVAGLHRLTAHLDELHRATVIIAIAGMEGALPSVVSGLVSAPVIAVPTSVGYGASFGGIAALLGMLNSCAAGVSVVNIDNGFGAAQSAAAINRQIQTRHE